MGLLRKRKKSAPVSSPLKWFPTLSVHFRQSAVRQKRKRINIYGINWGEEEERKKKRGVILGAQDNFVSPLGGEKHVKDVE